jgi:hypothetical protein
MSTQPPPRDAIPHSGDRPPHWCGLGHRDAVPYVEALAFWGRAVDHHWVPRSYALAVLADHALLVNPASWRGSEPPSRWERLWAAAEDLADWENLAVAMSLDGGDFFDFLRDEQRFLNQLAGQPATNASGDERPAADRAERGPLNSHDPASPSPAEPGTTPTTEAPP